MAEIAFYTAMRVILHKKTCQSLSILSIVFSTAMRYNVDKLRNRKRGKER